MSLSHVTSIQQHWRHQLWVLGYVLPCSLCMHINLTVSIYINYSFLSVDKEVRNFVEET